MFKSHRLRLNMLVVVPATVLRQFLQLPEIRRKYKRKWQLKQDYLEGYLRGLSETFRKQVLTNGYELALQVPEIVQTAVKRLDLFQEKIRRIP